MTWQESLLRVAIALPFVFGLVLFSLIRRPPPPQRRCEGCGATFETCWVIPEHGHPERERVCPGSGWPGEAP